MYIVQSNYCYMNLAQLKVCEQFSVVITKFLLLKLLALQH